MLRGKSGVRLALNIMLTVLALSSPLVCQFAYVVNNFGDSVSGYEINATTGALTPSPGSPFATELGPRYVAADPTGRFLYVPNLDSNTVSGYTINPTAGELTPVPGSPFATGKFPTAVVVHPTGKFAYVTFGGGGAPGAIWGYEVNPIDGALTTISGSPFPAGSGTFSVAIDPKGRFAYATNLDDNTVSGYAINAITGVLVPVPESPFATGFSPAAVVVDPTGHFAYTANFSPNISGYAINATSGALTPIPGSPFPAAGTATPNGLAVHPTGKFVYVANNDACPGTVSGYTVNATTGALTMFPGPPFAAGLGSTTSVSVDPTGSFAYVVNSFGQPCSDIGNGSVSGFKVNPVTGVLTSIAGSPFPAGGFPQVVTTTRARKPTLTVLHSFAGSEGIDPEAGLIRDASGNLYGTTSAGGSPDCAAQEQGLCGTVFKLDTTGKLAVLYSFKGGSDGANPRAPLLRDALGNLYGTTFYGGGSCASQGTLGCGMVFRLGPTGTETVLHRFAGGSDGFNVWAGLIRDALGNLYGTTQSGGVYDYGTVFKLDSTGRKTILHSFAGPLRGGDGVSPLAGLFRDGLGNLYGTTIVGGAQAHQLGTVFKLDMTGKETVLYSFTGCPDGELPDAALLQDAAGNLFGTTQRGGTHGGGTIFKLDSSGKETLLHSFGDIVLDGASPSGPLVQDAAGNFYGVTGVGGDHNFGTVFKLDASGGYTVLHRFLGGTDGAFPIGGLVLDTVGNLYGVTGRGGDLSCNNGFGCGTVFKLTP